MTGDEIMKYKLLAMDMDGTLLNSSKEVSEESRDALRRAAEKGVKLVICTGRIYTSARYYAGLIGTEAPIIASNGAYIREKDRGEIIFEKYLQADKVLKMVEMSEGYGFFPHVFTSDAVFAKKLSYFSAHYKKGNDLLPEELRVRIEIVDDLKPYILQNKDNIIKFVTATDDIENLMRLRKEIEGQLEVSIVSSAQNNIEIMEEGVSKGNAVRSLAEYFGFKREEVICIGDNENDMSMIEYAGLGIAMGNSEESLKNIANYITDTNDNHGVAKAIEKFILNC